MTKKHYIMLSGIIRRYMDGADDGSYEGTIVRGTLESLVQDLSSKLAEDNKHFNTETFEIACGL